MICDLAHPGHLVHMERRRRGRKYLFGMRLHTFFLWAAGHRVCRCSGARRRCSMAHRASAPSRTWLWGSR